MEVNEELLRKLSEAVSDWERKKARVEEGSLGEKEFETELDSHLKLLEKFEQEHGMRKIGEGRDRLTFTAGVAVTKDKAIVKVSRGEGGRQNREEVQTWKEMKEAREHVARLLDWSDRYTWIVQERVSQASPPGSSRELAQKLREDGWVCSDISPDNVGTRDGKPVLMDLGVGLRRID